MKNLSVRNLELNPSQSLPAMQLHDLINELFFEIFELGILLSRTSSALGPSMELDLICNLRNLAARYFPRRSAIGLNSINAPPAESRLKSPKPARRTCQRSL